MKELVFLSAVEDIERFRWETLCQLHSSRRYGLSDKFRIIVFLPIYNSLQGFNPEWKKIEKLFPETKFFYYTDNQGKTTDLMINYDYQPIHRLTSLEKHFKAHRELENSAVFYLDSDVIFTSESPIASYTQDDTNYLSDAHTYLNEEYLSSKENDVIPEKLEKYQKLKIIEKAASFAKLSIKDLTEKNNNTGGAQYLLKNMNAKFFSECIDLCLKIRMFFQTINQEFFPGKTFQEKENNGIQSYCADMWAIQWNLWKHNLPSETPKWMDFAWATDKIEALDNKWMLHNAGINSENSIRITENLKSIKGEDGKSVMVDAPTFWKYKYRTTSPFDDIPAIENIINNEYSQKYCTSKIAQEVLDAYNTLIKTK